MLNETILMTMMKLATMTSAMTLAFILTFATFADTKRLQETVTSIHSLAKYSLLLTIAIIAFVSWQVPALLELVIHPMCYMPSLMSPFWILHPICMVALFYVPSTLMKWSLDKLVVIHECNEMTTPLLETKKLALKNHCAHGQKAQ